ncbi:MAG: hypothetical protein JW395_1588 [Nitrospira sp.]|nr:hypothetical protein [Nitrospira sp.]
MTTRPSLPILPSQPDEYNVNDINSLINALRLTFNLLTNPGPLQGSTLNLSQIPSSGYGLRTGDVFESGSHLLIVKLNVGYPSSQSGTGSVGSVSVVV